jgi:Thiol-disulfide isomerase and thioredoxins
LFRWKQGAALLAAPAALVALTAPVSQAQGTVATIDAAGLKKQVAARKGKVVVVNFWATWCGPCVEEFPALVTLQNKNAAKGLDLVTVSFDEAEDKGKVASFLSKNKLTKGTFINKGGSDLDDSYIKYLEPKLPASAAVALPRTYIFDRSGKLVKVITGGQTLAQFQKAVDPYLAKK